jgi:hypothetical protein
MDEHPIYMDNCTYFSFRHRLMYSQTEMGNFNGSGKSSGNDRRSARTRIPSARISRIRIPSSCSSLWISSIRIPRVRISSLCSSLWISSTRIPSPLLISYHRNKSSSVQLSCFLYIFVIVHSYSDSLRVSFHRPCDAGIGGSETPQPTSCCTIADVLA